MIKPQVMMVKVEITVVVVMAMITNLPIASLWECLPASAKSTISQHNQQYNVNTAHQDNAGHIPKALWINCPHMPKCYIKLTMS